MEQIYPFSDDTLKYDYKTHKYYLTEECIINEMKLNLSTIINGSVFTDNSTLADVFLSDITESVYNWIYEDTQSESFIEYNMAKLPSLREKIKQMLKAQVNYTLRNGFIDEYSGVNVAKGTAMDLDTLRGRAKIAARVEQIANQTVEEIGVSLKYIGELPGIPLYCLHRGY